jgi:hypothetical protein
MQIILFKNDSESNETSIKTEAKKIIAKLPTIEQLNNVIQDIFHIIQMMVGIQQITIKIFIFL